MRGAAQRVTNVLFESLPVSEGYRHPGFAVLQVGYLFNLDTLHHIEQFRIPGVCVMKEGLSGASFEQRQSRTEYAGPGSRGGGYQIL